MYSVHHKLKSDADIDEHFAVLYFSALWPHQCIGSNLKKLLKENEKV